MLKRKELEDKLIRELESKMMNRVEVNRIKKSLEFKRNISSGKSGEMLNNISSLSIEELLWVTVAVTNLYSSTIKVNEYFTENEQKMFSDSKAKPNTETNNYPVIFEDVIKVTDTQWVCVTDINKLFELYEMQIINYNRRTQRQQVEKRNKNGDIYYNIYVNKRSVDEICEQALSNQFIPNAISLNINQEYDNDFEYTEERELILKAGRFDIIDGFHRYQGFMKAKLVNPDFNYPIIINFFNIDEERACDYIAQEDKRNKINQSYVKTMDSTNPINILIARLNEDSRCYLKGKIGREESEIQSVDLYAAIECSFKIKKENVVFYHKYLRNVFNTLIEDEIFDYSFLSLIATIKGAAMYQESEQCIEKIEELIRIVKTNEYFKNKAKVSRKTLKEVERLGENV